MSKPSFNATCPICKHDMHVASLAKAALTGSSDYNLLSCPHCDTVFFDPIPSPQALENHYSNGYSFYKTDDYKAQGKGMAFANKYLSHLPSGNFLDIGCANGYFLSGVEQGSKLKVFGTDINPEVVASVREKLNLDIRVGEIEDIGFDDDFFDFLHVQDVLEHVPDPLSFLKTCRKIIKEDGTLYLSVPNGVSDMQGLINYSGLYNTPAFSKAGHIYFFSPAALDYIFKASGFKVEKAYSCHFKKGLRNFSILPNERHWKENLTPPTNLDVSEEKPHTQPSAQKRRSTAYYKFRFFKDELGLIPGMHKYGNDFILILKPI